MGSRSFDIFEEHAILKHKAWEIRTADGRDVQATLDEQRAALRWLAPVKRYDSLPRQDNTLGDVRQVQQSRTIYTWTNFKIGWKYSTGTEHESADTLILPYADLPPCNHSFARLEGEVIPYSEGNHTFFVTSNQSFKLYIDGVSILNEHSEKISSNCFFTQVELAKGRHYTISLEQGYNASRVVVEWSYSNSSRRIIGGEDVIHSIIPDWVPIETLLTHIKDFNITSGQVGDILKYDGTHWVNVPGDLSHLNDVTLTQRQEGDILKYNGVSWSNVPGDLPSLNDVRINSLEEGQVLRRIGDKWINSDNNLTNMMDVEVLSQLAPHQILEYNGEFWNNNRATPPYSQYLRGVIPSLIIPTRLFYSTILPLDPDQWSIVPDLTGVVYVPGDTTMRVKWSITLAPVDDVYVSHAGWVALFVNGRLITDAAEWYDFGILNSLTSPYDAHTYAGSIDLPLEEGEHLIELRCAAMGTEYWVNGVARLGGPLVSNEPASRFLYAGAQQIKFSRTENAPARRTVIGTGIVQTISTNNFITMQDMSTSLTTVDTTLRVTWSASISLATPHRVYSAIFLNGIEVVGSRRVNGLDPINDLLGGSVELTLSGYVEVDVTSGQHTIELRWFNGNEYTASTIDRSRILTVEDVLSQSIK